MNGWSSAWNPWLFCRIVLSTAAEELSPAGRPWLTLDWKKLILDWRLKAQCAAPTACVSTRNVCPLLVLKLGHNPVLRTVTATGCATAWDIVTVMLGGSPPTVWSQDLVAVLIAAPPAGLQMIQSCPMFSILYFLESYLFLSLPSVCFISIEESLGLLKVTAAREGRKVDSLRLNDTARADPRPDSILTLKIYQDLFHLRQDTVLHQVPLTSCCHDPKLKYLTLVILPRIASQRLKVQVNLRLLACFHQIYLET